MHVLNGTHSTVHLMVESGPDRGREITIPPEGARMGRSSGNDLILSDPSISRFQCRFYFKDGRDLCISDLASTNETMVNDKPVQDRKLLEGDRVMVGETVLKVVCDTLFAGGHAPEAAGSPAVSAPAAGPVEAAAPRPEETPPRPAAAGSDIDLGLRPGVSAKPAAAPSGIRPGRGALLTVLILAVGLVAGLFLWKQVSRDTRRSGGTAAPGGARGLELTYEKVEASAKNIFRYDLALKEGRLAVRIDNLEDGRHVSREGKVDSKVAELLAESLEQSGFFQLEGEYSGLSPDLYYVKDLSITIGRRTHRSRVLNRLEPEVYKQVRESIEEFAQNSLGIYALALPPEKLKELAQQAWLAGQKMFDEREVRYGNLSKAIKFFTEVEGLLETIEPKPEIFEQAIAKREECRRLVDQRYSEFMFRADQAIKLQDWKEANANLQILMEMIPDRSDERFDKIYKKMVDVQRRLDRKS